MLTEQPTRFQELNALLRELVATQTSILDEDLVGSYLVGSFAVGDADIHSDCDFLVVVAERPTPDQERALRALHRDIPARPGHWTKHLEGSYAVRDEVRTLDGMGREWLYVDHGAREMEWSTHCNTLVHRWTLRERGVTLTGPDPKTLVEPVDPEAIRAGMRAQIDTLLPDLRTWIRIEQIAWGQRYAVSSLCRMLYSVETGEIASKKHALRWGMERLEARWRELIERALEGRNRGWDPEDHPSPESVEETLRFAEFAKAEARRLG